MSAVQARKAGCRATSEKLFASARPSSADGFSRGAVSGRRQTTKASVTTPTAVTAPSAARQPAQAASSPPLKGARMAITPRPDSPRAITCAPSCGSNRSRTMARAHTTEAAKPAPCTTRAAMSVWMSGASAAARLAALYSDSPPSSTGRRPKRSDTGPITSCARPNDSSSADMVSCASDIGAARSRASKGSAGR